MAEDVAPATENDLTEQARPQVFVQNRYHLKEKLSRLQPIIRQARATLPNLVARVSG